MRLSQIILGLLVASCVSQPQHLPQPERCPSSNYSCDLFIFPTTNSLKINGKLVILEERRGSQPQAVARDAAGELFFLKADAGVNELQTGAEVITARIYKHLGYKVLPTQIVHTGGKRYVAMPFLEGKLPLEQFLNDMNTPEFRRLRIFAAMLKDWDRLHGKQNLLLGRRQFGLLDFGGTLGAKAMGDAKPGRSFSPQVGGFEQVKDGQEILDNYEINWVYRIHPWHKLKKADLIAAAQSLKGLKDSDIKRFVEAAEYKNHKDTDYMIETIINRRDKLIEFLKSDRADVWLKNNTGTAANKDGEPSEYAEVEELESVPPKKLNSGPDEVEYQGSRHTGISVIKNKALINKYLRDRAVIDGEQSLIKQNRQITDQSDKLTFAYERSGIFSRLTEDQIQFLRYHMDSGSSWYAMNLYLRYGIKDSLHSVDSIRKSQEIIEGVIKKVLGEDLPAPKVVYRGAVLAKKKFLHRVGETFIDKGFISSSLDSKVAKEFTVVDTDHEFFSRDVVRVLYKIVAKKKSLPGVFLPGIMWRYNKSRSSMPVSPNILLEEEFLIQNGQMFKVIESKEKTDSDGITYVEQTLEYMGY